MTHFTQRKHLIDWLLRNCTRKTVVRAMEEGSIEHLGSFSKLGPKNKPGWIVLVTSERGKPWFIEVVSRLKLGGFGVYITEVRKNTTFPVPWKYWQGDVIRRPDVPRELYDLWDGDNPTEYERLRDERI